MFKKRILIVHNNQEYLQKIVSFFNEKELYHMETVINGDALMRLNCLDAYDFVIVKDAIAEISGLNAIEKLLKNTYKRPNYIILITPFNNNFIKSKCESLDIIPIYNVKMSINELYHLLNILELEGDMKNKKYFEPQLEIINLLKKIGLLKVYIGYTYFEYVLNLMLESSENIYKYMKNIYEIVANHFHVSPSSVEKAMRSCIKSSFSQNYGYYAKMLFGYSENDYPSTSIFLQVCIKTLKEIKNCIITNQINSSIRKI